ncbi:unnamed protein product [Chironomus riparius]|uniref:Uncharacterized protein n=1 Tax=Chironomus riparius TaxID=315576 RepID=A0A9N9S346_9DIPT|nr:unnamed protein product [Chironomus riparius]
MSCLYFWIREKQFKRPSKLTLSISPVDVNYPLDRNKYRKRCKHKDFEKLVIHETPSLSQAYDLLKTPWFRHKIISSNKIFNIEFKINKELPENTKDFHFDPDIFNEKSFLVIFSSTVGKRKKFYWKVAGDNKFLSFELSDKILSDFFQNFIVHEVKNNRNGLLSSFESKSELDIRDFHRIIGHHFLLMAPKGTSENLIKKLIPSGFDLYSGMGHNFLVMAAEQSRDDIVDKLLPYNFDLNESISGMYALNNTLVIVGCHMKNIQFSAIDIAWQNYTVGSDTEDQRRRSNKIILSLLNKNSRLPGPHVAFKYEKASEEVKKFIDMCEKVHSYAQIDDIENLTTEITQHPHLRHFCNRNNQSIMFYAKQQQKLKIINLLSSLNISIGSHEDPEHGYLHQIPLECVFNKKAVIKFFGLNHKEKHQ